MTRQGLISLVSLAICCSGLYDCFQLELPPGLVKGGHFQFLTNVSLILTIIYILQTIVTPTSYNLRLQYNVVSNLEFTVTVSYWVMHLILPHWLNTNSFERDYWLDFKIHIWPYVYLIFDNQEQIKPKNCGRLLPLLSLCIGVILKEW